jgi:hypothetical protein
MFRCYCTVTAFSQNDLSFPNKTETSLSNRCPRQNASHVLLLGLSGEQVVAVSTDVCTSCVSWSDHRAETNYPSGETLREFKQNDD